VDKEEIGIGLLGMTSAWGIWSATNSSPFTVLKFGTNGDYDKLKLGMNVGLAAILATAVGIKLLYKEKGSIPAIATGATGIGLWLWYHYLISQKTTPQELPLGGCKPLREEGCFNYLVDFK